MNTPHAESRRLAHEGWKSIYQDAYPEAQRLLLEAIALDPTNTNALVGLGKISASRDGDYYAALKVYDDVLSVNSSDTAAWLERSIVMNSLGFPFDALVAAEKAAALQPDFLPLLDFRAETAGLLSAERALVEEAVRALGGAERAEAQAGMGDPEAQVALGAMLDCGLKPDGDAAIAADLYRSAATRGHCEGQLRLAICYWIARGLQHDRVLAWAWSRKAAKCSSQLWKGSIVRLIRFEHSLGPQLTPQEIAEANSIS